ncbi:uncharacterized protein LOC121384094 [Gigantopelta aegis]|uniref:uncharacterized protein LOC121384094 n=1 Tax=Gigantopelta aegis TaxID=1735272 RepID=UPI001B88D821|nr:uncharacterized protein LOC121384094 [Gigantopelta aegis]
MDSTKWKIRLALLVMWLWLQCGMVTTMAVPSRVGNLSPEDIAAMPGYQINNGASQDMAQSNTGDYSRNDMEKRNDPNILKSKRNGDRTSDHLEPGNIQENTGRHGNDDEHAGNNLSPGTDGHAEPENRPGVIGSHRSSREHLESGQTPDGSREGEPTEGGEIPVDSHGNGNQNVRPGSHGNENQNVGPGSHGNENQNVGPGSHGNENQNVGPGFHGNENLNLEHDSHHSIDGELEGDEQENGHNDDHGNEELAPGEIPIITDSHADEQLGPGSHGDSHEPIQTGETQNNGDLAPGEIPYIPGGHGNHNERLQPGFHGSSHEEREPGAMSRNPNMQSNENAHRHPDEIPGVPGFNIHEGGHPVPGEISSLHGNNSEPEPVEPHQGSDNGSEIPIDGHNSQAELTSPKPSTKPRPTEQIEHNMLEPAAGESATVGHITPSPSWSAILEQGQTIEEEITERGPALFSSYSEGVGNSLHASGSPQHHLLTADFNIRLTLVSVLSEGNSQHTSLRGQHRTESSSSFHADVVNTFSVENSKSLYSQHENIVTMETLGSIATAISPSSVALHSESASSRKQVKLPLKDKKSTTVTTLSEETASVTVGMAHSVEIIDISPSVVSVEPTQSVEFSSSALVDPVTSRTVTSGPTSSTQTVGNGSGFVTTSRPITGAVVSLPSVSHEIVIHENATLMRATTTSSSASTATSHKPKGKVTAEPTVNLLSTVLHRGVASGVTSGRTLARNFTIPATTNHNENPNFQSTQRTVLPVSGIKSPKPGITTQRSSTSGTTSTTSTQHNNDSRVQSTSVTRTNSTLHNNDSRVQLTSVTTPVIQTTTSLPGVHNMTVPIRFNQSTWRTHPVVPSTPSSSSTLRQNTSPALIPSRETTPRDITPRATTLRPATLTETTVSINFSTSNTQETRVGGETTKRMTTAKTSTLPLFLSSTPGQLTPSSTRTTTLIRRTSHSSSTSSYTSSRRPMSATTRSTSGVPPTVSLLPSAPSTVSPLPSAPPTVSLLPSASPTISPLPSTPPTVSPLPSAPPTVSPLPSAPPTVSPLPSAPPTGSFLPSHPFTTWVTQKWHPTPVYHPPVFATVKLRMTWDDFCDNENDFLLDLVSIFHRHAQREVKTRQIMFININVPDCVDVLSPVSLVEHISIKMYLVDVWGRYDITLTIDCCKVIKIGFNANKESYFSDKLVEVKLNSPLQMATPPSESKGLVMETGIIIAIVIASVGGLCCITLIMLQIIIRRRYAKNAQKYPANSRHCSFTSTDSIALGSVNKARPHSGLFNPALDLAAIIEPSVPINLTALANKCLDVISLYEEFQTIPNYTPQLSTVPVGAEDKNRYANVIPIPHTRVKLKKMEGQPVSDYINANYITGYMDDKRAYIATQAPMTNTIHDFWRMVWEQQSRVIVMLTAMDEQGHPKCAHYWPDSETDPLKRCGDYMIVLKKKDVYQEYTMSSLELKDMENNLVREIKHFWYTCWPVHGIPEPISLVKFVLDTRPYYEDSGAPLIVHCSPGTGRTGTLITMDICMRQLENKRMVDIMGCVHQMRQERAGVIQTKEQYALIHMALNEYACVLTTPCISAASSSATLQTLH